MAGVPVPRVLLHGELSTAPAVIYVLMTRLPGVRWADRRASLDVSTTAALTRGVGRALRNLHALPGPRFGAVLAGETSFGSSWEQAA